MNAIVRRACNLWRQLPSQGSVSRGDQVQQFRGIRVRVLNGNLEQALRFMQKKMHSSGMERMLKKVRTRHVKKSEKRVLARKNLELKTRSQELASKLKIILANKVRGL